MSDSNTLLRFGRPARRHQRVYCNLSLRIDWKYLLQIQMLICCLYNTQQFFAVRTGIEPVTTDRQSVMLAITPTNQNSGVPAETVLHTIVFRACIVGKIRTCSLSVPGGVSNQLECYYIFHPFRGWGYKKLPRCISREKLYSSFCI